MRPRPAPTAVAAIIAAALATAGCSIADEVLFRTFAGEAPAKPGTRVSQVDAARLGAVPPGFQRGIFRPGRVTRGAAGATPESESGRAIALARLGLMDHGIRIRQHNDQLQARRRSFTLKARGYSAAVAGLQLKGGDEIPANDEAFAGRAAEIRSRLDRVPAELLKFNGLAANVLVEAAAVRGLLESTGGIGRRPGLSAAEREELARLQREIEDNIDLLNRFSSELSLDIDVQTKYVSTQRTRFDALVAQVVAADPDGPLGPLGPLGATGEARAKAADPGPAKAPSKAPSKAPDMAPEQRPLVTIRFDSRGADYARPLRLAVQEALDQRPDARFEIVGLSPAAGKGPVTSTALMHALGVQQTLEEMGLPGARMMLSSATSPGAAGAEVRVFVRVAGVSAWAPPAAATPLASGRPPQAAAYRPAPAAPRALAIAAGPYDPRPLVTIRFDRPDVAYAEQLREAMQAALDRRPGARFELVSIAAGRNDFVAGANAALARADAVMRTLAEIGLPKDRVTVEATATPEPGPDTVLIFVR